VNPVFVQGLGLFTPGFADPEAWCIGKSDPSIVAPEAGLLTGPLKRRATCVTKMGVEVFQQATAAMGSEASSTPSVWATSNGEHSTALKILEAMVHGEGKLSPTQFHNSVHNTAGGYASIATKNEASSTTLTGGNELVNSALLEAICRLETTCTDDVVLVLADEPLLPPFERGEGKAPLAIAFHLSSRRDGARAVLSSLRRDRVNPVKGHELFGRLYIAAALPLFESVVSGRSGTLPLELEGEGEGPVSCVDVEVLAS
jgi:hypothetical protein